MNYAEIREVDAANCKGVGTSIFVSGCRHHCKGCFQPELWNFDYGSEFTDETINTIMGYISKPYIRGFSFLGGDPFEPENVIECGKLAQTIREKYPEKKLYAWTGCLFEEVVEREDCSLMLNNLDYLIDGEFKEELHRLDIHLAGSSNQRIIDVKESLKQGKTVCIDYENIV